MAERKAAESTTRQAAKKADGESAVLAKIAAMSEQYRAMGERLHAIIKANAPALAPLLWYGAPAYARDGKTILFFRVDKYMTFGFTEQADFFDEGANMQASAFALKGLTAVEEEKIGALVRKVVG